MFQPRSLQGFGKALETQAIRFTPRRSQVRVLYSPPGNAGAPERAPAFPSNRRGTGQMAWSGLASAGPALSVPGSSSAAGESAQSRPAPRLARSTAPDANSGVYVRVPSDGRHHGERAGIEVQSIMAGSSPETYGSDLPTEGCCRRRSSRRRCGVGAAGGRSGVECGAKSARHRFGSPRSDAWSKPRVCMGPPRGQLLERAQSGRRRRGRQQHPFGRCWQVASRHGPRPRAGHAARLCVVRLHDRCRERGDRRLNASRYHCPVRA